MDSIEIFDVASWYSGSSADSCEYYIDSIESAVDVMEEVIGMSRGEILDVLIDCWGYSITEIIEKYVVGDNVISR